MANNIITAEKYANIVDEAYKKASLTSVLDAATKPDFSGAKTVKVMKVETTGLGDYSKQNGYAKGNVSVTWEDMTLSEDRSAELEIDRMDDEETLGMAIGAATKDFMQMNVGPEVDAYRFMKYAKLEGIGSASGALADGLAVVAALRGATVAMDEAEVPAEDRVLFITPTLYGSVQDLDTNKSYLHFSISSSSLLLTENDLESMFDPYKIVDTTNRKNILRAIILANVKNLVKALDGQIWVETQILKNTCFNILIPNCEN